VKVSRVMSLTYGKILGSVLVKHYIQNKIMLIFKSKDSNLPEIKTFVQRPSKIRFRDFWPCVFCVESCVVELRSWGFEDNQRIGYVRLNGRPTVELNYSADDPYVNAKYRGINTNLIRTSDCTTYYNRSFDTNAFDANINSARLVEYLESLTNGVVLCGVSCDAADFLSEKATSALLKLGVDLRQLSQRGKLTFVAIIGRPRSTIFRLADKGGDNLFMTVGVTDEELSGRSSF